MCLFRAGLPKCFGVLNDRRVFIRDSLLRCERIDARNLLRWCTTGARNATSGSYDEPTASAAAEELLRDPPGRCEAAEADTS
jgi:hypothetical protein